MTFPDGVQQRAQFPKQVGILPHPPCHLVLCDGVYNTGVATVALGIAAVAAARTNGAVV